MTVTPGQLLSHYRIVGKIGEGGMGVVYRAEDTRLRRHVALKILPAHLVASPDRRRRFLREARAAAAVTHPNITTIHEVEEAGGLVFIAMELVEGQSMRQAIRGRPLPVKDALRLAVEMAEGLAEAHKAHIVHRDLKPENVIVTTAGHAKLLDFGLAKFLRDCSEQDGEDPSRVPTASVEVTVEGRILGTPAYMSPEQVRGQAADTRSDVFSFGATLYEMLTGRPPFKAPSAVEVMAAVLGAEPTPPGLLNEEVPGGLERIVVTCLRKERDERYRDAQEVLAELRRLQEGRSGTPTRNGVATERAGSLQRSESPLPTRRVAWAAAAMIGVAAIALVLYAMWNGASESEQDPLQTMRISSITGGSDIQTIVLSPDARHLALVRSESLDSPWRITMRQMATGSEVQVLAPQDGRISHVSFSRDGERLFYNAQDANPAFEALFEIPALGGEGRKHFNDLDSPVGFSPDGRKLAFARQVPREGVSTLATYDLGAGAERVLATVKSPLMIGAVRPAWSPDGLRIVGSMSSPEGGGRSWVVAFDSSDGRSERVGAEWIDPAIDSIAWLGRGGLVLSARDAARGFMNQLYHLSWPDGRRRRITNDLNDYRSISVSEDGSTLAALRFSHTSNLWSVSVDGNPAPGQLTFGSAGADVIGSFSPVADGSIAFTAGDEAGLALWAMRSDGSARRRIGTDARPVSFNVMPLEGRPAVAFNALGADLVPHVWRMDVDGGNAVQLTNGTGEVLKAVAPDGRRLLFVRTDAPDEILALSTEGGDSEKVADDALLQFNNLVPRYSPDGALIQFPRMGRSADGFSLEHVVTPASGGEPLATFRRPPNTALTRWHPDGKSLTYRHEGDGVSTVMRWPIAGGDATPMFSFREGPVEWYDWSPDGRALVFRARDSRGSNLWLWRADGSSSPTPLTRFSTGEIHDFAWACDSRSVYFTQGISNRDVVVFRGMTAVLRIQRVDVNARRVTLDLQGRIVAEWAELLERECAELSRSGLLRGGDYRSRSGAGPLAAVASGGPFSTRPFIGFRCDR